MAEGLAGLSLSVPKHPTLIFVAATLETSISSTKSQKNGYTTPNGNNFTTTSSTSMTISFCNFITIILRKPLDFVVTEKLGLY